MCANPQKEDGYTAIANEILEVMAKQNCFGFSSGQLIWAIFRKTYGWHKTEDFISINQLMQLTGLSRRTVIYSLQELEAKNIILIIRVKEKGLNKINLIKFNKNYDTWVVQNSAPQVVNNRKQAKLSSAKLRINKKGSAKLPKTDSRSFAPTKDIKYTKEIKKRKISFSKKNKKQNPFIQCPICKKETTQHNIDDSGSCPNCIPPINSEKIKELIEKLSK